ncbi:selenide, water dikinase [Vallitalea longa]|uniref:Selenide, water dikinase n=1 Tax=Vallitalea longa TaxID=2936439 RepID=A0A9W5YD23_9FIRM|nr:selenide, water dikinase [Vallitalea longa]
MCHLKTKKNKIDPNLIVGLDTSDDAGVYKIKDDYALIQTVDFFTPIVDDPYTFGQIAATNALSDVYAMGGRPLTAMNMACFATCLEPDVLAEILRGGADKIDEAEAVLVGGHTITDKEVKYGLSVTGYVHPDDVLTNAGAEAGDVLVLTKPIGTGILTTALKKDLITENELEQAVISMSTLNKSAAIAMSRVGVHACTDITGFGILGHTYELASGSNVNVKVKADQVPLFDKTIQLIEDNAVPGGARSNQSHFGKWINIDASIPDSLETALYDPQTSGGLLISVAEDKVQKLIDELNKEKCLCASIIGKVYKKDETEKYINVY